MSSGASERPPEEVTVSWRGALVALLLGIVLTLGFAEVITRILYEPAPTHIRGLNLRFSEFYQPDPELGWVPRPEIGGSYRRFPASFTTNSRGLRDSEHPEAKPGGVARIVLVGDSHTWGYGVNDDEIYAAKLEAGLERTEVINLGVTAYSLWQEIGYFRREGVRYGPDVLLVGFTQNDVWQGSNEANIARANAPSAAPAQEAARPEGLKQTLLRSSALYRFVRDRLSTNKTLVAFLSRLGLADPLVGADGIDNNLQTALLDYPADLEASFQAVEDKLRELKRVTDDLGVRLVVVAIPARQAIEAISFEQSIARSVFETDDFDLDKPYERLAALADEAGFEFVNPVARFREEERNGAQLYLQRDVHLSVRGHEVLAEALAEHFRRASP